VLESEIEFDEELEEVKRTLRDVFMILYYNGRSITIRPYEAVLPFFTGRLFLGAEIKDGRIEVLLCSETRDGIVSVEIDPENPIIREEDLKRARLLYPRCFVDISDLKDPMEVNVRIKGPFAYVEIPHNYILVLASPFYRKPTKYAMRINKHGKVSKDLIEVFKERPVETLAKYGSVELIKALAEEGLLRKISDDEYESTIPPERIYKLVPVSSSDPITDIRIKGLHMKAIYKDRMYT